MGLFTSTDGFSRPTRMFVLCAALLTTLLTIATPTLFAQNMSGGAKSMGNIPGVVIDARSGEAVIGATVMVDGTQLGAATDLHGKFLIKNVPFGTYTLSISSVGYTRSQIAEVVVSESPVSDFSIQLMPEIYEQKAVKVTAKRLSNTEGALLKHRQAAVAVSDAIGADAISKSGSGDAAQAMTKVTGASVVGGKYVFVRGLGDRYSNTLINGSLAPSADPDKQAVNMDLVPSGLLDNIVVEKTFTPDKPGNFAGGSVNLNTKDIPDHRILAFSTGGSYNTQATSKSILTQHTGSKDWIGMDDGARDLPAMFSDPTFRVPQPSNNDSTAAIINNASKSFGNRGFRPSTGSGPVNQSYGLTYGDNFRLFGAAGGIMSSFNYSRSQSHYSDGQAGSYIYQLGDNALSRVYTFDEAKSKDEVLWGGLLNSSFMLAKNHKVGLTWVYNQSGEATSRINKGWERDEASEPGFTYRANSIEYTERRLSSAQLKGEHAGLPLAARLEWKASFSDSKQYEPDARVFSDVQIVDGADTNYNVGHVRPQRYFRTLNEDNREGRVDMSVPFKQWSKLPSKLKIGAYAMHKKRDFRERHFLLTNFAGSSYQGDPDAFLDPDNIGWLNPDTVANNQFGPIWTVATSYTIRHNYDAKQDITAGYGMMELPLTSHLNLVGGLRYEATDMWLDQVLDTSDNNRRDLISAHDWLPSVNVIYKASDRMNFRGAYTKTLARPTLRELALFSSIDLTTGRWEIGNPELDITYISNIDLRWEWFVRPGEILALSLFSKRLTDPIEKVIIDDKSNYRYENVDKASTYGLEIEGRLGLGVFHKRLTNFNIGGNLSLIESRIDLTQKEIETQKIFDPNAPDHRPMWGQSPYVVNLDFGYGNQKTGTSVNFLFNRFGERLSAVSKVELPDIYERPRTTIDVTMSQRIFKSVKLKAAGKNLTNARSVFSMEYNGQEYVQHSYGNGRTYGFGVSVEL